MPHFLPVLLVIAFAAVVVTLTAIARRFPVPTPIMQVAAGLAASLIPGIAIPELEPEIVFFLFLPPILWAAAFFTSQREFRQNLRSISLLAVGLVTATTAIVAVVAHALLPGLPWAVAVVIGAIVSPPDAVAAEAIVSRLKVPRRVIVILEGESLVNDASALVLYRTAVAAAVTGMFSWGEALVRFFLDAGFGVLVGLLVGWVIVRLTRLTRDRLAETLLSMAGPYICWVGAEAIHVSAVLACVAGGFYVRRHWSTGVGPVARIESRAVWELWIFILNALVFLLLGLQLGNFLVVTPDAVLRPAIVTGLALAAVAIVVRLVWMPFGALLPRALSAEIRRREPRPSNKAIALVAWTGMRGIVSLATALALPLTIADGSPFPFRTEIVVITMTVIVMTLVVQGLTLAPLIRWFDFPPETQQEEETRMARREAIRRATEALDDLSRDADVDARDVEALRRDLTDRMMHHERQGGRPRARMALRLRLLEQERTMLVRLRNEGAISDQVLLHLETELDLEATKIGNALNGSGHH
ncbi:MAG: Na+/H+ antiporter [Gemmatimonadaceae bacterium]|nr:Na+/H+ antiporter [Gemmatimonadaceae bacterium]